MRAFCPVPIAQCVIALALALQAQSPALANDRNLVADELAACQREPAAQTRERLCSAIAGNAQVRDDIRAEALLHQSTAATELGKAREAVTILSRAIALNPIYPALYVARATHLVKTGAKVEALADLSKSLALDPKNAEALSSRGALYLLLHRPDAALADFQALIFLDPAAGHSYAGRGMALEANGERDRALIDYRKAIELDGVNEVAARGVARLSGS